MQSFNLAPIIEVKPPDPVSFKPCKVHALDLSHVQSSNSSKADELVLLKRLWQELQDLPAHEVDAGLSHLLMRLCQLLQAQHVDWCLHRGLPPSTHNLIAQQAAHHEDLGLLTGRSHSHGLLTHTFKVQEGVHMVFTFKRDARMPVFEAHQQALLSFALAGLQRWLTWLALSHGLYCGGGALPPHLRKTLLQLLTGQLEKQIASSLGISTNTAHHYVVLVYRHFSVRNRASLMSLWL